MKITEHFSLEEFACHDGTAYPDKWVSTRLDKLCQNLEKIREALGEPMIITSGYRTPAWNRKQGGAVHSQHLEGRAADFYCKNTKPAAVAKIVENLMDRGVIEPGGLGVYNGFTHYDVRGVRAKWYGSRPKGQV